MKILRKQEIRVISEENPNVFEQRVNALLAELAVEDIEPEKIINPNPLVAILTFTRTEYIAENKADEDEIKGLSVKCKHCVHFEYDRQNRRYGYCELKGKRVYSDVAACKLRGVENDD